MTVIESLISEAEDLLPYLSLSGYEILVSSSSITISNDDSHYVIYFSIFGKWVLRGQDGMSIISSCTQKFRKKLLDTL